MKSFCVGICLQSSTTSMYSPFVCKLSLPRFIFNNYFFWVQGFFFFLFYVDNVQMGSYKKLLAIAVKADAKLYSLDDVLEGKVIFITRMNTYYLHLKKKGSKFQVLVIVCHF